MDAFEIHRCIRPRRSEAHNPSTLTTRARTRRGLNAGRCTTGASSRPFDGFEAHHQGHRPSHPSARRHLRRARGRRTISASSRALRTTCGAPSSSGARTPTIAAGTHAPRTEAEGDLSWTIACPSNPHELRQHSRPLSSCPPRRSPPKAASRQFVDGWSTCSRRCSTC